MQILSIAIPKNANLDIKKGVDIDYKVSVHDDRSKVIIQI